MSHAPSIGLEERIRRNLPRLKLGGIELRLWCMGRSRPCPLSCRMRNALNLQSKPYAAQRNITWVGLWLATWTVLVSVC
jgi:hypothetical protein